jgi:hypothetical protein
LTARAQQRRSKPRAARAPCPPRRPAIIPLVAASAPLFRSSASAPASASCTTRPRARAHTKS